jgi:hypothetical protein
MVITRPLGGAQRGDQSGSGYRDDVRLEREQRCDWQHDRETIQRGSLQWAAIDDSIHADLINGVVGLGYDRSPQHR